MSPDRAFLNFVWGLLRRRLPVLGLASMLMALGSALSLAMPWFAGRVTAALLAGLVPDRLLFAWLGILLLQALVDFSTAFMIGREGARLATDLGNRVYDHLQGLPVAWHHDRRRGETLSLLGNDVSGISAFLTSTLSSLLPLLLTCVGAFVLLLGISPSVGIAIACAAPLLALGLRLATRRLRPLALAGLREDAVRSGIAAQNLAALPAIKAFTREAAESERYLLQGERVRDLEIAQLRILSALGPAVRLAGAIALVGVVWLGARSIVAGTLSAADLVTLLLYGLLLLQPASQLAGVYGQVQTARGAGHRLIELLQEPREHEGGPVPLAKARGEIHFEGVGFAYPGRTPLFDRLELRIHAGETVAITGPNGAGKTTLAHLLLRFADPSSGRVLLDGHDLKDLALRDLRGNIGLVSQHLYLFNSSLAFNIAYGRPGASAHEIEEAARSAGAHEFIAAFPEGYETVVGDEGTKLSGGQKQRIALARALLKDPAILILDEATAMFDPAGERELVAQCHSLLRHRTVLIITHRPASLALADRVVELRNGAVVEPAALKNGSDAARYGS